LVVHNIVVAIYIVFSGNIVRGTVSAAATQFPQQFSTEQAKAKATASGGRRQRDDGDGGGGGCGGGRGRDRSRGACRLTTAASQSRTVLALNRSGVITPCAVWFAADLVVCHIAADRPSTRPVNIQRDIVCNDPKDNSIVLYIIIRCRVGIVPIII